jgi:hypothetical protein
MTISIHVHGQLNDFLPRARRDHAFALAVEGGAAVKDVIESVGVPHTEIDAIFADGVSVTFSHAIGDGERLDVYPPESDLPAAPVTHLQPEPLAEPRFILDVHLGRLAAYLRLLGLDTTYSNDCDDPVLAERSAREHRILLTRDVGLLKRGVVRYGSFVRATQPERQLEEVIHRYHLKGDRRALARIDRRTLIGKRDYALLLLALSADLGAAELSGLRLGDLTCADDHLCMTISWRTHDRKQSAKVRHEIGPDVALPLSEWMLARLALGALEHDYVFITLSTNGATGAPLSVQSIKAMSKKWLGTSRRPARDRDPLAFARS